MNTDFGQPVVSVTIGSAGPFRFSIDTVASMTVIDAAVASELKLPKIGRSRMSDASVGPTA